MKLFTDQQWETLVKNGEEPLRDHVPVVRLVMPDSGDTWLLTHVDRNDPDDVLGLEDRGWGARFSLASIKKLERLHTWKGQTPIQPDATFEGKYPLSVYAEAAKKAGHITLDDTALEQARMDKTVADQRQHETFLHDYANRVVHGDCTQAMQNMPTASVDLIVTDPPYLVNYRSRDGRTLAGDRNDVWLKPASQEMYRVLKDDRFAVSFYGYHQADKFLTAWKEAGFRPVGHFTFVKDYSSRTGHTRAHHENAYLLAKGNPARPENAPRDVLDWKYTGNHLHPTQKPVSALAPLIEAYSKPGDVVLDPFAGSGTTGVAAQELGRNYVLIETDAPHVDTARARLEKHEHGVYGKFGATYAAHQEAERDKGLER